MDKYEIFLKVVDSGSISRAAELLNYTQSGISRAVAALEEESGVRLLNRGKLGVALTDEGERLYPFVQAIVNQQNRYRDEINTMQNKVAGKIRIGVFTSVSAIWMPQMIGAFTEKYPEVQFEIYDGYYASIRKRVLDGRLDVGFVPESASLGTNFIPLCRDPLMALVAADHPLADRDSVTLEEFFRYPFIMPGEGSSMDVDLLLEQSKIRPNIAYTLRDDLSVIGMTAGGQGVAVMPRLMTRASTDNCKRLFFQPPQYRTIGLATSPNRQMTAVTKAYINHIREMIRIIPGYIEP